MAVERPIPQLSLFFFGADSDITAGPGKYDLFLKATKLADESNMSAIWVPERHFQRFGGLYGSPSIMAAALAVTTRRIRIRAGSVVLPLQNAIRVAEEWSMIDNLSNGRVDIAVASGWHPNDFVLSPSTYATRHQDVADKAEIVERLWRGEPVTAPNGLGDSVEVRVLPRPLQPRLQLWLTAQSDKGFELAAERNYNILTANFTQQHDARELTQRIAPYRERMRASHDRPGLVTLMSHTFIGSRQLIDDVVKPTMTDYQTTMTSMVKNVPVNKNMAERDQRMVQRPDANLRKLAELATSRVISGELTLIGTMDECKDRLRTFAELGIDEVACLIDFGIPDSETIESMRQLCELSYWAAS